jgi:hypothetical protein
MTEEDDGAPQNRQAAPRDCSAGTRAGLVLSLGTCYFPMMWPSRRHA